MRFVVFLDIDGVLNTRTTVKRTPYGYTGIDDARVKVLANAIEKCGGGDIVLSSDWKVLDRNHDDYRYLVSKLEQCGLKISDHTIDKERKRGQGVKEYLESHPEIEEFVILDDQKFDFEHYEKIWERLLITNGIERAEFASRTPAVEAISSKQQLYVRIGEALHVSPDTVKYWQRDKSSGPDPRTPELLKELEDYLGYPDALQKKINIEEEKTEDKRMDTVSEFQKQQIMEIYEVLKNFVSEMNIENEDEYYRIRAVIERKQLVLPDTIFNTILQFTDNVVEEYVFEAEYPDFTKEEAEYENGVMNIKTDAAFNKLMSHFLERLQELDKKIDQFAEQELRAYLLG